MGHGAGECGEGGRGEVGHGEGKCGEAGRGEVGQGQGQGQGQGGVGKGEGVGLAVTDSKSSRALRESKVELKRKCIHICKEEVLLFQTGYTSFYFAI